MAYATGNAAGPVALLTALRTFLLANGWTSDEFADLGGGKVFHTHKGSLYMHFRAFVNETISDGH